MTVLLYTTGLELVGYWPQVYTYIFVHDTDQSLLNGYLLLECDYNIIIKCGKLNNFLHKVLPSPLSSSLMKAIDHHVE